MLSMLDARFAGLAECTGRGAALTVLLFVTVLVVRFTAVLAGADVVMAYSVSNHPSYTYILPNGFKNFQRNATSIQRTCR